MSLPLTVTTCSREAGACCPVSTRIPKNSAPRDRPRALCHVPPGLHGRLSLKLQKNAETKSVRNQQQRHQHRRNEECGSQLPRQESGMVRLVENIEKIGCTPQVENPRDGNTRRTRQQEQRKQSKYG